MDSLELRGEEDEVMMLDEGMVTDDLIDSADNNATTATTEFHINLDKCPPSLQNTLINEKVYINEKYKRELDEQGLLVEIDSEKLKEVYDSLGLTEESFDTENMTNNESASSPSVNLSQLFRRDSLHLHGVDELKTQDIFDHFAAYNPYSLEWINDSSCNVVWKCERLLLKALVESTGSYDPSQRADKSAQQPRIFMRPPKNIRWRITNQPAIQRKSLNDKLLTRELNHIFVRFVRKHFDRKRKGAESKSIFYVKYGNPNYGNLKGLISDSKRRNLREQQLSMINSNLDDISRIGPIDHQAEEEDQDQSDRKLISYNFELSGLNEIEEFGTGSSPVKTKKPAQPFRREDIGFTNRRSAESRPVYKKDTRGRYKKMYMDELEDDDDQQSPRAHRSPSERGNRSLSRPKERQTRESSSEDRSDSYNSYKRKNESSIDQSLRSRLSGYREPPVRQRSRSPLDYESRHKRRSNYRRDDYSDDEEDNRHKRRSGGPRSSVKSVVIAPNDLRNRLSNRKWN